MGNACSENRAGGHQISPFSPGATAVRALGDRNQKLDLEVGEAVADRLGQRPPGERLRRVGRGLRQPPRLGPPRRRWQLDHPAEQALLRPAAEQHGAVLPHKPEGHAVAQRARALRRATRQALGRAFRVAFAGALPGAGVAAGLARRADAGTEIHQRLRIVAGPPLWCELGGEPVENRLGRRQRRLHGAKAGDHALDVAVDDGRRPVMGDGRDRCGGVAPDPGQRPQRGLLVRELPVVIGQKPPRAGVQVARPRVVAESLPGVEHLVELGAGQSLEARPALQETLEVAGHHRHRGLLQHDLAEPDPVGVGPGAGRRAPGQVAAVAVVPVQQRRRQPGGRFGCRPGHRRARRFTDAADARTPVPGYRDSRPRTCARPASRSRSPR